MSNGFSLDRLDPLRGKCDEMIKLLKRCSCHDADETIYGYITRQNMIHLCHLYGKHFQQNMSIIHAPTFDMAASPPTLLLATMLVGACYAPDTIPPSQVAKLARSLLTAMALDPVSVHCVFFSRASSTDDKADSGYLVRDGNGLPFHCPDPSRSFGLLRSELFKRHCGSEICQNKRSKEHFGTLCCSRPPCG